MDNAPSLTQFVEEKINHYARMIADYNEKADELAFGQLSFYMALRRVLQDKATTEDKGMMDAVNDVLQHKGLVAKGSTFYK